MMKAKNKVVCLLIVLFCAMAICGVCLFKAQPILAEEQAKITLKLNGGFYVTEFATDSTSATYSEEDVEYLVNKGKFIFTHTNVRAMFGNMPVYLKANTNNTTDFTTTTEGYYHAPTNSNGGQIFTDLLFGVFEDLDSDGIVDDGETLYRSGDTIDINGDTTLTCYYSSQNVYKSNNELDRNTNVVLNKAWKNGFENALEYYTVKDLQPFYHTLVEVGDYGFSLDTYTGTIRGVELPNTVTKIGVHAFALTTRLEYVKGTENVKTYNDGAFWAVGLDVNSYFRLEVAGSNNDIAPFAFSFMKKNVEARILYTANNYQYKIGMSWRGNNLQFTQENAEGVSFDDPCVYAYVLYGKTEEMYIDENNYINSSLQAKYTEMNGNVTCQRVNTPVREMYKVSFILDGGNVNGTTSIKNTYMDARAVSVTREGAEANLTVTNDAGNLIRSYNPAEQTLSLLKAERPQDPTKEGYAFGGWMDQNGYVWTENDWNNGGYAYNYGSDGATLTAVWKKQVEVTYKYNNSQEDVILNTFEGATLIMPEDPIARAHYTFTGWYSDAECLNLWNFDTMTVNNNLTLYAGWKVETYTATLFTNDGVLIETETLNKVSEGVYKATFTYNLAYELPIPTLNGYTFEGWYENSTFNGDSVSEIAVGKYGAPKYYAKWSKDEVVYNITYVLDGGINGNNPLTYVEGESVNLANATKNNFTFEGWYLDSAFTQKVTQISVNQTGDITLYAKFVEIENELPIVKPPVDDNLEDNNNDSGCRSSVVNSIGIIMPIISLICLFVLKKKRDN